jgi:hypothetical protein
VLGRLRERFARILARAHASAGDPKALHTRGNAGEAGEAFDAARLLAWAQVEAVVDLLAQVEPEAARGQLPATWELELPLLEAFGEARSVWEAQRRAALVLLGVTLSATTLREGLGASLVDERGKRFLGVHEASGVVWLGKESFEELARFVADRDTALGRVSVALSDRQVEDVTRLAATAGYRAAVLAEALVPEAAPAATELAPPPG